MFKKIFITLLIVIIVLFAGVSLYVSTIDWNRYKDVITSEVEEISGKKIQINGKVNLSFLPKPHLTAENIKIYNKTSQQTEPLAQIESMVMDLSLMPLLHKQFVIDKMNMTNAVVVVEFLNNGHTNWYSQVEGENEFNFSNIDIAFNSITLENSKVRIINSELNSDMIFDKVNADISGQSIVGPFRIDGNFVKDGTPAGFALNIGTLSESFATSLNLVLTHPSSESYARFDGSVLSNNSEIQGDFKIESQKPVEFINTLLGRNLLPEQYNYELASEIQLKVNKNQIDLPSVILKYGKNMAGSGNILIPLTSALNEPKKITASFEMTDLDLIPPVILLKDYLRQFENKQNYDPAFEYDFQAKLTARLAHTGKDIIRNFEIETSLANNVWTITKLSGLLPGDTDISVSGNMFEQEKILSYNLKVQALSQDFYKFLEFINLKPQTYTDSTYRNARASFGLSGNLNQIKIAPLSFGIDNIETSGTIGINRSNRYGIFVALQSDSVNFDNYFSSLTAEEKKLSTPERLKIFLNRFKFINDVDIESNLSLRLGIYDRVPFENMIFSVKTQSGKATISTLDIGQIAGAHIQMKGDISGLGINPTFENFKYSIETQNFKEFSDKMNLNLPQWPLFQNQDELSMKGIISGTLDAANTKITSKFDHTDIVYSGTIHRQKQEITYRGHLNVKTPDFVNFANQINLSYNPSKLAASVFTFDADVAGSFNDWHASDINTFIGQNNFKGSFSYKKTDQNPIIKANIENNIFEFDRFIYAPKTKKNAPSPLNQTAFLEKPVFDTTTFDYELFKKIDLTAKIAIKNLSYLDQDIENVNMMLNVANGVLKVDNLSATKYGFPITSSFEINATTTPQIKGSLEMKDADLNPFGGSMYAVEKGKWTIKVNYEGAISSLSDFITQSKGTISFDISKPVFKGMDFKAIEQDLQNRKDSDKLEESLTKNLTNGSTELDIIGGDISFENGKFVLSNAVLSGSSVMVDFNGEGSLESWNSKLVFHPKFSALSDQILPFHFEWNGSLSQPALSVDAKDLKNSYDSYWAEIKRQADEKEKARIEALHNHMKEVQDIVTTQSNVIQSDILPRIKRYKSFSNNSDIMQIYENIEIQIEDVMKTLKEYVLLAKKDYQEEDIDKIKIQTDIYASLLPELLTQLDQNYLMDLKARINIEYKKINDIYQNSLEKSKNYQDTLNAYSMRLVQLGSLIVLDDLGTVKTDRIRIEKSIEDIASFYRNAEQIRQKIQENDKIMIVDKLHQDIAQISKETKEKLDTINTDLEHLFEYVQDIVYFEQTGKERPKKSKTQNTSVIPSVESSLPSIDSDTKKTTMELESKTPQKFSVQQTTPRSEATVSKPEVKSEEIKINEVQDKKEEKNKPQTDNTLLKPVGDSYVPFNKPSGKITLSGTENNKTKEIKPSQTNLLKPISEPLTVQGSIKVK